MNSKTLTIGIDCPASMTLTNVYRYSKRRGTIFRCSFCDKEFMADKLVDDRLLPKHKVVYESRNT